MTKEEWEKHCKWLDTFRGETVYTKNDYHYKEKKTKKK